MSKKIFACTECGILLSPDTERVRGVVDNGVHKFMYRGEMPCCDARLAELELVRGEPDDLLPDKNTRISDYNVR